MPRPGQPDEPDQAGRAADDGLVPGLPSRARAVSAAASGDLQYRLGAAGRSAGPGAAADRGQPHRSQQVAELYDLSPLSGARGMTKEPLNLAALRARLAGRRGKEYWRSLEELAETADFQDLLRHEFPQGADIWEGSLSRRGFLKVMGASLAMAGLTGCSLTSPQEKI